jgi:hypothetical protein
MRKKAIAAGFTVWTDPPAKLLKKLLPGELLRGVVANKAAILFLGTEGVCVLAIEEPEMAVGRVRVKYCREAKVVFQAVPSELGITADLQRAAEPANKDAVMKCMIPLAQFIRDEFKG